VGVICTWRHEVRAFTEAEVDLLATFAAQAVIAIENVRLFTELQEKNRAVTAAHAQVTESLEQQTATSEILRVISSSPTHLQPVMNVVAESAARVCGAIDSSIFRLDGDALRLVALHGALPSPLDVGETISVTRDTVSGRAVSERRTIHVEDMWALPETEFQGRARWRQRPHAARTFLAAPLLREGVPLGAILIRRREAQPFSARQIELLETFAHQAVIAIENVRLFTELRRRIVRSRQPMPR
jgi:two-component system NtrC family sensor kinase